MSDNPDYQPLVARYRPRKLSAVVGQEQATTELEGMLLEGRIGRAYLLSGPFGDGKCVAGHTLVPTERGLVPIRTLMGPHQVDHLGVNVMQEYGRLSEAKYSYRGGVKDTIKIRTHHGYSLEGTPNHRIRVMTSSGKVRWRRLDQIQEGDYACISRNGLFGSGSDLSAYAYVKRSHDVSSIDFVPPTSLTPEWGRLLGYLVGDGSYLGKSRISISCAERDIKRDQLTLMRSLCGHARVQPDKRSKVGLVSTRCSRVQVRKFLEYIGLQRHGASSKEVPWAVMAAEKSVVREFLRGYFEADGSASRAIEVTTKSRKLANQVHLLLLQFGVVARLAPKQHKKYGRFWRLIVGGSSKAIFEQEIGFVSDRKIKALRQLVSGKTRSRLERHGVAPMRVLTNIREVVPHQREHLAALYAFIPASSKRPEHDTLFQARYGSGQCTTRQVSVIANDLRDVSGSGHFHRLEKRNYFYDPIVRVSAGRCEVYDLNVPAGKMFAAGGFMNHNTTLARILAKRLNCLENKVYTRTVTVKGKSKEESYVKYEACDKCKSCLRLNVVGASNHPDVIEINASSERGIETIRSLNTLQQQSPSCRFKVFLIDEAHGLTGQAASAFLKTLEEPSKRSIFILCTTNPEKILPTIASRCKRVQLRLVDVESATQRLAYIAGKEGFEIREKDVRKIAEMSRGHMRDAVEMLEKVINYFDGKKGTVKPKKLTKMLPEILDAIIQRSPAAVAESYVKSMLDGDWESMAVLSSVESPEYFFQLVITTLKGILFVRKVPQRAEPFYRRLADANNQKRVIRTKDLAYLYNLFLDGYEQLKRYVIASADALDNTAIRAVTYTSRLDVPEEEESTSKSKEKKVEGRMLAKFNRKE